MILYLCSHFLSVNCRKSRNNSFSILSLAISRSYSSAVDNGCVRGRPLGGVGIPFSILICCLLCRVTQVCICRFSNPKLSAISRFVYPAYRISMIWGSTSWIRVYFRFAITMPPHVVIILHKGAFCLLSVFTGAVQIAARFLFWWYQRQPPAKPGVK